MKKQSLALFENQGVRRVWDELREEWYFSVVDVVGVLTGSKEPRRYWSDLKIKLKKEGSQLSENIVQLKMLSSDGKKYKTDAATAAQLLRLIQSIPSKKAEPFKLWLARVGNDRLNEINDPELAFQRAMETYLKKGYDRDWINQRLLSIRVRKQLTDEWDDRGVKKGLEYAILTDEITKAWSGLTTRQYKNLKGLKKENLRDNMSTLKVVLTMLAEASTTEISKKEQPAGLAANVKVARKGGQVAGNARREIEGQTGREVIKGQLRIKN